MKITLLSLNGIDERILSCEIEAERMKEHYLNRSWTDEIIIMLSIAQDHLIVFYLSFAITYHFHIVRGQ